ASPQPAGGGLGRGHGCTNLSAAPTLSLPRKRGEGTLEPHVRHLRQLQTLARRARKPAMVKGYRSIWLLALIVSAVAPASEAAAQSCPAIRKINVGVSVAPPNVVHTSPYVAKELGFFAKRCIEPNIIQFEGGASATSSAAAAQGSAIV